MRQILSFERDGDFFQLKLAHTAVSPGFRHLLGISLWVGNGRLVVINHLDSAPFGRYAYNFSVAARLVGNCEAQPVRQFILCRGAFLGFLQLTVFRCNRAFAAGERFRHIQSASSRSSSLETSKVCLAAAGGILVGQLNGFHAATSLTAVMNLPDLLIVFRGEHVREHDATMAENPAPDHGGNPKSTFP